MKIMTVSGAASGTMRVDGGFDSALLRRGEPLFLDDSQPGSTVKVMPAIYISRQGRHILPANSRHYALEAGPVAYAPSPLAEAEGIAPGLCDRAFAPGDKLPLDYEAPCRLEASLTTLGSGETVDSASLTFSFANLGIDEAICRLSEYVTLRTGDIILFADAALTLGPLAVDTCLQASFNSTQCLSFRIK